MPAGNGVEGVNVLLKLMYDDKDVAVLAADPEGCKLREIPHLQQTLIQNKPSHASGNSTFMITIKIFFPVFFILVCAVLKKLPQ